MENDKKEPSEHLDFMYNRLVNVHKENPLLDYMHKFKSIIEDIKKQEDNFNNYLSFIKNKPKKVVIKCKSCGTVLSTKEVFHQYCLTCEKHQ